MVTSKDKDLEGDVAVADKPVEKPVQALKAEELQDDEQYTILYGWGRVPPGYKQYVDKSLFENGVARNVLGVTAKHWLKGTRPDGKTEFVYGKVTIQAVLPNIAKESDFVRVTGIEVLPTEKFAAMLAGVDLDAVVKALGEKKVRQLIEGLSSRVPERRA
jgi:hypothetical protein